MISWSWEIFILVIGLDLIDFWTRSMGKDRYAFQLGHCLSCLSELWISWIQSSRCKDKDLEVGQTTCTKSYMHILGGTPFRSSTETHHHGISLSHNKNIWIWMSKVTHNVTPWLTPYHLKHWWLKMQQKFCFLKTKEGEYIQQMKLSINSLNLAFIHSHENSSFKILQKK